MILPLISCPAETAPVAVSLAGGRVFDWPDFRGLRGPTRPPSNRGDRKFSTLTPALSRPTRRAVAPAQRAGEGEFRGGATRDTARVIQPAQTARPFAALLP